MQYDSGAQVDASIGPMLANTFLLVLTIFSFLSAPQQALAGPVVAEAERAMLRCMSEATKTACDTAEEAARTISAVALANPTSTADFYCVTDVMNMRSALTRLKTSFITGEGEAKAKGDAYTALSVVKRKCARF
ncbi:MAG: hypothetical protein WCI65_07100 [Synechococcaceae cyanobacterium ELA263]